jgi:hypothetical protein
MKIKFSRESTFIPEWNGNRALPEAEQVKCILRPMEVQDVMLIMDAMGGQRTVVDGVAPQVDAAKFVTACSSLMPKYVTIENLDGEDGPIKVEELTRFAAFVPLAAEILMQCANTSVPSDVAEGNLGPQPG